MIGQKHCHDGSGHGNHHGKKLKKNKGGDGATSGDATVKGKETGITRSRIVTAFVLVL